MQVRLILFWLYSIDVHSATAYYYVYLASVNSSVNDNGLLGRGHKPEPKHDKAYSEKVLRLSLNEAIIWPKRNGSNSRRPKKRN